MKSLPIPRVPLFAYKGKPYLVTVCHFTDWIEYDELSDTLSSTIVAATRVHFTRFGIPTWVIMDNGPQLISKEYKAFSSAYGFSHTTSFFTILYPLQCRAEAAVKVCKNMLKKCVGPDLAKLMYRNTPQQGYTYSPAQCMFSRHTCTTLSVGVSGLSPTTVDPSVAHQDLSSCRQASKLYYDRHAIVSSDDVPLGAPAYAKSSPTFRGTPWKYGVVVDKPAPLSYVIRSQDG